MRLYFTDEQKEKELNKAEIEDVLFTAAYLEGEEKNWIMTGSAMIDGEVYSEFTVEIETEDVPPENDAAEIMAMDWAWFDFLFDI